MALANPILDTAQGTSPVAWRILILGDLHFKKAGTGSGAGAGTGDTCAAMVPLLITQMKKYTFTHCILGGDIGHGDGYGTLEDQALFFDMLVAAFPGVTFWKMVGNHEHNFAASSYATVYARFGIPSLGYDTHDIGTDRFIFLNSMTGNPTQVGGPYSLGATQRTWLTDLLAASTAKRVHIFSHVPIFGYPPMQWRLINALHDPLQSADYNATVDQMLDFQLLNTAVETYSNIVSIHGFHIHYPRLEQDWGLPGDPWCFNWGAPCGFNWVLTNGSLEWNKRKAGFGELVGLTNGTLIPTFHKFFG